jgi:hypothetical protein
VGDFHGQANSFNPSLGYGGFINPLNDVALLSGGVRLKRLQRALALQFVGSSPQACASIKYLDHEK